MNNIVENVIATIIVSVVSIVAGLISQAFGLSPQASVIVALFILVLMLLFLAFRRYYPIYIRRLTQRLIEDALRVNKNESDEAKKEFKKKIVDLVLRENFQAKTESNDWITLFQNQAACESNIREACRNAKKVKILTIRGEVYFLGSKSLLYDLCLSKRERGFNINVLVLSPESSHITEELAIKLDHDSAYRIREKMSSVLGYLKFLANENKNFEVRCYDETPNFKILLFDDVMFVSAFTEPKNDHNAKMLQITREGTPLFIGLERYFDELWRRCNRPQ